MTDMINPKWITLPMAILGIGIGVSCLPGLSASTLPLEQTGIDIAFNPETDQATVRPDETEQTDHPFGSRRVIIGEDERAPVLTRTFPWAAMGRLDWRIGDRSIPWCTATLISQDMILTNAHCLERPVGIDEETNTVLTEFTDAETYAELEPRLVFTPAMIDGLALDEATVITFQTGWSNDSQPPHADWAILQLDTPLGDSYGSLGWRSLDFDDSATLDAVFESVQLMGYSGDFPTENLIEFGEPMTTAGVDSQCSILGVWREGNLAGTLIHDCDTTPGASGGPILAKFTDDNYYIVGLHARSIAFEESITLPNDVETTVINGGIEVSQWSDTALEMVE